MSAALAVPLWKRALRAKAIAHLKDSNRSARARLALAFVLRRAGYDVSLVAIHAWSRAQQGTAYLWATGFIDGREDVPAPEFVRAAAGVR